MLHRIYDAILEGTVLFVQDDRQRLGLNFGGLQRRHRLSYAEYSASDHTESAAYIDELHSSDAL